MSDMPDMPDDVLGDAVDRLEWDERKEEVNPF